MKDQETAMAAQPARRLTLIALAVWAVVALALPLSALTLNAVKVAGFPLGFWLTAEGCLLALLLLAILFARRSGGGNRALGFIPAVEFAGETVTSAGYIGFAGLIAALGFDGLAYPLGIAAGLALMTILVAPRLPLYAANSVAGFFAARFGGHWPRRLVLAITVVTSVLLLAADLRGAGLAAQGLMPADYQTGVIVSAAVLGLALLAGGLPRSGAFGLAVIIFLAALVNLAVQQGRWPLPHVVYGAAMQDIQGLDQKLFASRLAGGTSLMPMDSPFLHLSMVNFLGLVLGLSFGIAALPHVLGRYVSQAAGAAADAPMRVAKALAVAVLFLIGIAAFSVLARVAIEGLLLGGLPVNALPEAMIQSSGRGWLEVCGAKSFSGPELAAACAKLPGQKGLLRLQDLVFSGDGFLFAASSIAGLPALAWTALLAAGLVVALVSAHAILAGLAGGIAEARGPEGQPLGDGRDLSSLILRGAVLLAAIAIAAAGAAEIPALVSDGLGLIASSVFPALILGLYWRRYSSPGAIAAMVAGFAVAGCYIAGVRLFPVTMFELTGPLSSAAPAAVRKFADLKAALAAAPDAAAREIARIALGLHAQPIANWWGLKPGAAALLGAPAGFFAGVVATIFAGRPSPQA